MKLSLFLLTAASLLSSAFAQAYTVSWKKIVAEGMNGNYGCYATDCTEGSPAHESVNCKNFSNIMFSYSDFAGNKTTGYAWLTWDVDGPTHADWQRRREYTIDGAFSESGFTSTGQFKTPMMGSNGRVDVQSMRVDFLPPYGALAKATIDLGGNKPMTIDLECCRNGQCDSETPVEPSDAVKRQEFQNPPRLCPSAPKAARDACLAEVAAANKK